METFTRYTLYLKNILNLKEIKVNLVDNHSRDGGATTDKTLETFRRLDPELIKQVYQVYRYDFELFGYSPDNYLKLTNGK